MKYMYPTKNMRTKLCTLVLAVLAATGSANYLPATQVHSLAMRAILGAHSKVHGRKMQDLGDVLVADLAPIVDDLGTMICEEIESEEFQQDFVEEMEGAGIVCEYGCDDLEIPNLIMSCNVTGVDYCQEEADQQFCVSSETEDTEIQLEVGLDFSGESQSTSIQCNTYTSPEYMAGRVCWTFYSSGDLGAMLEDIVSGDVDPEAADALDYFDFINCSAELEDGTTCQCGLCNEGTGVSLGAYSNVWLF